PPASLDALIAAVVFGPRGGVCVPTDGVQQAKADLQSGGHLPPVAVEQPVVGVIVEVVMTVTRRIHELWIRGRVPQVDVRRPLIARLGREAKEFACARLHQPFDDGTTAGRRGDGCDPWTD